MPLVFCWYNIFTSESPMTLLFTVAAATSCPRVAHVIVDGPSVLAAVKLEDAGIIIGRGLAAEEVTNPEDVDVTFPKPPVEKKPLEDAATLTSQTFKLAFIGSVHADSLLTLKLVLKTGFTPWEAMLSDDNPESLLRAVVDGLGSTIPKAVTGASDDVLL